MKKLLLLGQDYPLFGSYHVAGLTPKLIGAISAGADKSSPSMANKGDEDEPNEDAVLIVSDGSNCLLAVADGHFGCGASHTILDALSDACESIPRKMGELRLLLSGLAGLRWGDPSGSTLIAAVLNQETRSCFGVSWGDSLLMTVGPSGCRVRSASDDRYIRRGSEFLAEEAFEFRLDEGDVVTVCTDGIFECHYGSPLTSLRPQMLQEIWKKSCRSDEPDLKELASAMVIAALQGVNGFPGGQDNIGLILATA